MKANISWTAAALISFGIAFGQARDVEPPDEPGSIMTERFNRLRVSTNLTITNGVWIYTKVTNIDNGPKTILVYPGKMKKARGEQIEKERKLGVNTDIRERWEVLKKKAESLRKGMTVVQAAELMGKPMRSEEYVELQKDLSGFRPVAHETAVRSPAKSRLLYSPDERENLLKSRMGPDERLWLKFDDHGALERWDWD